ncbi:glycosyltransferase family 2 protein [Aureitalea marina]|uniref:Glycosyl transferase n=1 Tax=Aureitalea marina TaxID=930804 RepID=A0A2S7KTN5_9FLAO|nr:glycosyltransferase family 2 protein [Aureitalea marina]PQB05956.1 glycosyl transferase [Aureitalea marina]
MTKFNNGSKKNTLGVVAIAYNEEIDLPGFLSHLTAWVDEIVIVDDGSTDRTGEIAHTYGDKVKFLISPREEGQYYSDQRNKGIAASESQWLLHMDIDERVPPELSREIIQAIQRKDKDAYRFRRLNYFMHRPMKGGGWSDWNLVHLCKRKYLRFGGMYHETIDLQIPDSRIGQLNKKMYHFNDSSYNERLRKSLTYQEEVIKHLRERGVRVGLWNMIYALCREFGVKYFYKRGFQDGTTGFISAFHSSFAMFKAYALLWEEQNRVTRAQLEKEMESEWNRNNN